MRSRSAVSSGDSSAYSEASMVMVSVASNHQVPRSPSTSMLVHVPGATLALTRPIAAPSVASAHGRHHGHHHHHKHKAKHARVKHFGGTNASVDPSGPAGPGDAGTVASFDQATGVLTLTLDTPGSDVNVFDLRAANALASALETLDPGIEAVVLASTKPGSFVNGVGLMMAGAVVTVLPVLLLFLALQRYYMQGLLMGSVKQ